MAADFGRIVNVENCLYYLGDDVVEILCEENGKRRIRFDDGQELLVPSTWLKVVPLRARVRSPSYPTIAAPHLESAARVIGRTIRERCGGIAPHRSGDLKEEYRASVPLYLRNRQGLPPDEVAAFLAEFYPQFGIECENDLYGALT